MSLLPKMLGFPNDIPLVLKRVLPTPQDRKLTSEEEFERLDWVLPEEVKKIVKKTLNSDLDPQTCQLQVGDRVDVINPMSLSFGFTGLVVDAKPGFTLVEVPKAQGLGTRVATFHTRSSLLLVQRDGAPVRSR